MGMLFVISAPSGAGKTTLTRHLLDRNPDLVYSVSYTTRLPRPGEINGRDYTFVSRDEFQSMINRGLFLEWAEVYGHYYGTGRNWVEKHLAENHHVVADVDVVGARQIRANFKDAVLIFIVPPSLDELANRLTGRNTENSQQLQQRLGEAKAEIKARHMFDYLVINDTIDEALSDLESVIRAEQLRMNRSDEFWSAFPGSETGMTNE
jgi:guanylate kinase